MPTLFFRELVHQALREEDRAAPNSYWQGLVDMPGAWAALWATLKDLKDAGVSGDRVLDALESPDAPIDPGLEPLMRLFQRTRIDAERLHVFDHDDLAQLAAEFIPSSRWLQSLTHVFYYGFYDLTQVQLDMFETMARACPTTLFFPLIRGHPAFVFANKFFDTFIHGLLNNTTDWRQIPATGRDTGLRRLFAASDGEAGGEAPGIGPAPALQLVQTSGREDEVTFAAKDILRLVEEQGYVWRDIGVVGRTLAGYETILPRVFRAHGIPFTTTLTVPLSAFPFVKTALQLLDLKVQDYRRDLVIDLLSSTFVRLGKLCPSSGEPRPDLWNVISRRVGITKGLDEWARLTAYEQSGLPLRSFLEDEESERAPMRISGEHIRALSACVAGIHAALQGIPDQGTWNDFVQSVKLLWDAVLDITRPGPGTEPDMGEDSTYVMTAFATCIEDLTSLGRFPHVMTFSEFVSTLHRHVEDFAVPMPSDAEAGVRVLDAMAARGLAFRSLYILGLNERIFPRHIREDAFLRDASRRFLEADLGFKIQEKLAGFEEEKLLFYLLANAATERITLLHLRADDAGRPLVPSLYLDEVCRLDHGVAEAELIVPLRWTERWAHPRLPQYHSARLTIPEWTQQRLLLRQFPPSALESHHPGGAFLMGGLEALRRLESADARLGEQDGVVGVLPEHWRELKTRGLSPTSLERYAKCPFHYFAGEVLGLEPLEAPESVGEVVPLEIGTLAHALLRAVFDALVVRGHFTTPASARVDPIAVLREVAPAIFEEYAHTHPVGYQLLWELQRETLTQLIGQVVMEDLAAMAQGEPGDWRPILFEAAVQGKIQIALSGGSEEFPLQGRVDRVDWSDRAREFRVIDYKYKAGGTPRSTDLNLSRAAARGVKLQPPFYLLMAEMTLSRSRPTGIGSGAITADGVWFYYLAPNWRKYDSEPILRPARFPGDAWRSSLRGSLDRALAAMLSGIRSGEFFMYPGAHCESCDFAALCRKSHQPSWWRARADHARLEPYRRLRRAEPDPR